MSSRISCAVIQANLKPEEALGALWALACLNCGLMVAAAALFAQDGLSFFNALLVQHLVWSVFTG